MSLKNTAFRGVRHFCGWLSRVKNLCCFTIVLLASGGCTTSSLVRDSPDRPVSSNDLFPEKLQVHHAKGFTIQYFNHYKVVKVLSPFEKSTDTVSYVLLQRGALRPKGYENSQVVEIPLRSLVGMSSLHIGLVDFLQAEDVLVGLGNLKYVSSPGILEKIKQGKILEAGKDQTLNEEKLITMHPDLIMATGSPIGKMNRYESLKNAGIPVLINSEWVEKTPLGRAEWVKLLAALLNKEGLVNKKFGEVETEYNRLAEIAKQATGKPSVLTGMNSRGTWFVPNGDGYMVKFIKDAAGSFHWEDTKSTGSLPLNFETVYPVALHADYWINVSIGNINTKTEILSKDSRYVDFKAYKSGQIYNYNKRMNEAGANDYWESGAVNPQLVLADLIKILHPELLPKYELRYYKQIL